MAKPAIQSTAAQRSPGRPRKLTRAAIIDAAIDLVDSRGPNWLSMRSLAKHIGCNHATLYNYFENVDAIQAAAIERLYSSLPALPGEPVAAPEMRERLIQNLETLHEIQKQHPQAIHAPVGSPAWKISFARMNQAMHQLRPYCESDEATWYALYLLLAAIASSAENARLNDRAPLRALQSEALQDMSESEKNALAGIIEQQREHSDATRFRRMIEHTIDHLIPGLCPQQETAQ